MFHFIYLGPLYFTKNSFKTKGYMQEILWITFDIFLQKKSQNTDAENASI